MDGLKDDTSVNRKPAEKKSRFRISWDETDTSKTVPNTTVKKKKIRR